MVSSLYNSPAEVRMLLSHLMDEETKAQEGGVTQSQGTTWQHWASANSRSSRGMTLELTLACAGLRLAVGPESHSFLSEPGLSSL